MKGSDMAHSPFIISSESINFINISNKDHPALLDMSIF